MNNSLPQSTDSNIIGFPEGQLLTTGLSDDEIQQISEAYRDRAPLPTTGDPRTDEIIERLKTTSYYQNK